MIKRIPALLICSILVLNLLSGCSPSQDEEIKIGVILPLSGKVMLYGTQARDAINMAIDEINAKGGVLDGKKLRPVIIDNEANPEKSKDFFNKLVSKDRVSAIIGPLTSDSSLAVAPEAQKNKIVMITPTSTNEKVTQTGDYIFRACYTDTFQALVDAKFAWSNLNAKKAAVLFDSTSDYSKGLMKSFISDFSSLGGEIPVIESYTDQTKDFNDQLSKIKETKVDVIYIPDYYNSVIKVAKQIKSADINTTLLGTDGWEDIASNAGDEVLGSYFSNHYTNNYIDTDVKKFAENYKSKYKVDSNAFAALSYDSVYLLADAIEKAGSSDSEKVRDALMQTDKKYVTGLIKFDENRNPIKPAYIIKISKADGDLMQSYYCTENP